MAIKRPDIYEHNNPSYAIVDSDSVRGGIRTSVNNLTELYNLDPSPSSPDQFKEYSTKVYVHSESAEYMLVDINNIGNSNGWQVSFGSSISGVTNGLNYDSNRLLLGGTLIEDTTIVGSSAYKLNFLNLTEFKVSISGINLILNNSSGLRYGADYSGNFNNRSLVDKAYVDSISAGLDPKNSVIVATTPTDGNIVLSSFSTGSTIDGINIENGDRILIKNQTISSENGIYIYSASTESFERSFDFSGNVSQGSLIPVISGITNYNSLWILTTNDPITIGSTDLEFTLFSKPTDLNSGIGIDITSNVISVDGGSLVGNSLSWNGTLEVFDVDVGSGTLKNELDGKVSNTVFNSFTANTITGVTDTTTGVSIQNGVTSNEVVLKTLIGSGSTTIVNNGDQVIIYSVGGKLNVTNPSLIYSATTTDEFIGLSGGSTVYLPDIPNIGLKLYLTNIDGTGLNNNITIDGNGKNINGFPTAKIDTNYGSITIVYNGSGWSVIGFIN